MIADRLSAMWRLINEPPIKKPNDEAMPTPGNRGLWRIFWAYYLRPHAFSVTLVLVLSSVTGVVAFMYAWAGKVIADDIVQIGHVPVESEAKTLDPTMPGQRELFKIDENRQRDALTSPLDEQRTKSVPERMTALGWLSVIIIGGELLRHLCLAIMYERTVHVGQQVQFRLRQKLHDKIHALPLSYHDRHSPGALLTHLFSDVGSIQNGMTELMRSIPANILNIIVGIIIVMSISPTLTMLVIVAMPAYWICYLWFQRRLRIVYDNIREREGRLNGHISNRISNFQLVKAFVRERTEAIDFLRQSRPIMRDNLAAAMLSTGFVLCCAVVTGTATTLTLWFGALSVRDGTLTLGELLMFFGATGYLFAPIAGLTHLAGLFHRVCAVADKVLRLLDQPIVLDDPKDPLPVPKTACEIRLENVSLRYDPQRPPAINNVSFTLPAGKRLCVMGPSGSGKTTLAKIMARLYDPTSGTVYFDGIDIKQFRVSELRELVGFVSQEPIVFSGTIGDNIRYGNISARMENVVAAAQFAQIHEFINRLPERYRTLTHERGLTLSGGQKQRVNLARALLYDPVVLVLDDCTSALDAETEAKLVASFETALKDRTAVLVTHRVSIARECDLVVILDDGKVVEFGQPDDLLKQNGAFAALHHEQVSKGGSMELVPANADLSGVQI